MPLLLIYGGRMKNERKFEYQARKIRQLEEDLKQAKSSATALECENKSIQRKYEAALEAMERMKSEHQTYADRSVEIIAEAADAKRQYEALIAECVKAKAEYTKQITKLIGDLKVADRHSNKQ